MYSSRNDQIVADAGCFANIYRLPNFTGATVVDGRARCQQMQGMLHSDSRTTDRHCAASGAEQPDWSSTPQKTHLLLTYQSEMATPISGAHAS